MFLHQGQKVWWLIPAHDLDHLERRGHSEASLRALSFTDLLSVCDGYLWGKLYVGLAEPRDFIYFPEKCSHAVTTYDKAFGVSGYV